MVSKGNTRAVVPPSPPPKKKNKAANAFSGFTTALFPFQLGRGEGVNERRKPQIHQEILRNIESGLTKRWNKAMEERMKNEKRNRGIQRQIYRRERGEIQLFTYISMCSNHYIYHVQCHPLILMQCQYLLHMRHITTRPYTPMVG